MSAKETGYIHGFQGYTEKLTEEHVTLFISECEARKNQKLCTRNRKEKNYDVNSTNPLAHRQAGLTHAT